MTGERRTIPREAADDAADRDAVRGFRTALARGDEQLLPAAQIDHLLGGESPIGVWREHRGLTIHALAERPGLAQAHVSQIEIGKRSGSLETLTRSATALRVPLDDLAPAAR